MTPDRDDDVRDDAVARAWQAYARETPPPGVDDAIRAAARRAVGTKPRAHPELAEARGPWRWWMPLAAAATIGAIAIGVIQSMPEIADEPYVVSDAALASRKVAPEANALPASPAAGSESTAREVRPSRESTSAKDVAPKAVQPAAPAAPMPRSTADAKKAPTPEQRDSVPLPMPRSEAARAPLPRQDAAKPDDKLRRDAPAESKETFVATPPVDDRQRREARASGSEVAALEKRNQESDATLRKSERDAASGFAASPPAAPAVVAAAPKAAAPASAPARAPDPAEGMLGAARESADAVDATARAKQRAAVPERAVSAQTQATAGARAMAEPQAMAVAPPDVFIAEIRRLLAAGDREGAVRELQRFRRTHVDADARFPEDLKAFGTSVPR